MAFGGIGASVLYGLWYATPGFQGTLIPIEAQNVAYGCLDLYGLFRKSSRRNAHEDAALIFAAHDGRALGCFPCPHIPPKSQPSAFVSNLWFYS